MPMLTIPVVVYISCTISYLHALHSNIAYEFPDINFSLLLLRLTYRRIFGSQLQHFVNIDFFTNFLQLAFVMMTDFSHHFSLYHKLFLLVRAEPDVVRIVFIMDMCFYINNYIIKRCKNCIYLNYNKR